MKLINYIIEHIEYLAFPQVKHGLEQEGESYVELHECKSKLHAQLNKSATQNEKPCSLQTWSLSTNNKNKKKIASALQRRTMRANTIGKYFLKKFIETSIMAKHTFDMNPGLTLVL